MKLSSLVVGVGAMAIVLAAQPKAAHAYDYGNANENLSVCVCATIFCSCYNIRHSFPYSSVWGGSISFGSGGLSYSSSWNNGESGAWVDQFSSWEGSNEWACMWNAGYQPGNNWSSVMTYAWNGVCHTQTNQGLYQTPIPWVADWGDIGGAGTSQWLYCTMGIWYPGGGCFPPPC